VIICNISFRFFSPPENPSFTGRWIKLSSRATFFSLSLIIDKKSIASISSLPWYFLKAAVNAVRKYQGKEEIDAIDFLSMIKDKLKKVALDESFIHRPVNDGFSGGEKKRNEILQMITLEPRLAILDETDSGLDIDALKIVAQGVNEYRSKDRSFILITHYQRILNYMEPDFVHVLMNGKLVKSGNQELAKELEEKGYSWIEEELAATAE
jgi:Fe-S cluster assembly ATP-binding protein